MFTFALWARGLRLLPRTIPGTSASLYTRDIGGHTQHWTILITGRWARETWTSGREVLSATWTCLWFRDEAAWVTRRHAELHAIGWRFPETATTP